MAIEWHFVSNNLKFHLFHAKSECCDSNISKSKVTYGYCMPVVSNPTFHAKSACFDSNMSESKVICG